MKISKSLAALLTTTMIAPASFADLSTDLNRQYKPRQFGGFDIGARDSFKLGRPGNNRGGFGREVVERIPMNDRHYRGSNTIYLKRELQRQGVRLRGLKLVAVKLIAKTKHGQGTAAVTVGHKTSRGIKIAGHPADFNRPRPRTFDRQDLRVPKRANQQGVWQVQLRGNFKVRRVVVTMAPIGGRVQEVTLRFNGQQYRGQSRIPLKMQLQRQLGINANNFDLKGVTLVAKTRMGRGSASVLVGHHETNRKRVDGNPRKFERNRPRTFDTKNFNIPGHVNQNGRWQLLMNGNFKVKTITLKIKRKGFGRH